jgi:hypothetical protein
MILKTNTPERLITDFEPRLSPDFAARVVREAARIRLRRRVLRGTLGIIAISGLLLLTGPARFLPSQTTPNEQLASSPTMTEWSEGSDSEYTNDPYSTQYDADKASAANYMFPDASSVEEFNSQLSNEPSTSDYSIPTDYYGANP